MRIISGTHKGIKVKPKNGLQIRPTTDRAKESLFNIINNRYYFKNKNVLDLFSGSGNIAFEFASRGAEEIISIDNNSACINFITSTSEKYNFNIKPINSDCLKYINNCMQKFNFIFADPPYNYQNYNQLKQIIIEKKLIKKDGLLIIEHDKNTIFEDANMELRKYGSVHFSLFSF